jgi:hypothetical protein
VKVSEVKNVDHAADAKPSDAGTEKTLQSNSSKPPMSSVVKSAAIRTRSSDVKNGVIKQSELEQLVGGTPVNKSSAASRVAASDDKPRNVRYKPAHQTAPFQTVTQPPRRSKQAPPVGVKSGNTRSSSRAKNASQTDVLVRRSASADKLQCRVDDSAVLKPALPTDELMPVADEQIQHRQPDGEMPQAASSNLTTQHAVSESDCNLVSTQPSADDRSRSGETTACSRGVLLSSAVDEFALDKHG